MGDSAIRVVGPQRMTPPHLSQEGIEVQQQVQRHLGRCLMRIQQYEHIAKALAAHADIAGPANELLTIQGKRIEKAATASLGTLVKGEGTAFTNLRTLFTANEQEGDTRDDNKRPADQIFFSTRFRIELTPEDYEAKVRELDVFVALRNRLVHHFMDDFDIFSDEGCERALQHLHASYAEIDRQFLLLQNDAKTLDQARQHMAAMMRTPEFMQTLRGEVPE
jgi:hypothetical protein